MRCQTKTTVSFCWNRTSSQILDDTLMDPAICPHIVICLHMLMYSADVGSRHYPLTCLLFLCCKLRPSCVSASASLVLNESGKNTTDIANQCYSPVNFFTLRPLGRYTIFLCISMINRKIKTLFKPRKIQF